MQKSKKNKIWQSYSLKEWKDMFYLIIWNIWLFAVIVETDTSLRIEKLVNVLYMFTRKTKGIEAFSAVK